MEKINRNWIINNRVHPVDGNTKEQIKLAIQDFVNRVKAKHL
jgi:hypothetical protein